MVRVRCISGCRTGRPLLGARSPMIFIMKSGSIFATSAGSSGGNSTTSSAVPRSGGSAVGLAPLSSVNERGHDTTDVGCGGAGARQDERDDRAEDLAGHCVLLLCGR